MDVLIFKTNISTQNEYLKVKSALEQKFELEDSTIDLDDCDKVLRVITDHATPQKIEEEVKSMKYQCEELTY